MTKTTKTILLVTTSTIAVISVLFYVIYKKREKERQAFYENVLSGMTPIQDTE